MATNHVAAELSALPADENARAASGGVLSGPQHPKPEFCPGGALVRGPGVGRRVTDRATLPAISGGARGGSRTMLDSDGILRAGASEPTGSLGAGKHTPVAVVRKIERGPGG